jgi:hypothetical protein
MIWYQRKRYQRIRVKAKNKIVISLTNWKVKTLKKLMWNMIRKTSKARSSMSMMRK